jgi:hypothetical protein
MLPRLCPDSVRGGACSFGKSSAGGYGGCWPGDLGRVGGPCHISTTMRYVHPTPKQAEAIRKPRRNAAHAVTSGPSFLVAWRAPQTGATISGPDPPAGCWGPPAALGARARWANSAFATQHFRSHYSLASFGRWGLCCDRIIALVAEWFVIRDKK